MYRCSPTQDSELSMRLPGDSSMTIGEDDNDDDDDIEDLEAALDGLEDDAAQLQVLSLPPPAAHVLQGGRFDKITVTYDSMTRQICLHKLLNTVSEDATQ